MRDDGQRLADIVEAAKAVVNYVRSAPAGESAAPQLIDATFFNVIVIGEAVRMLLASEDRTEDAEIIRAHPELPWRDWVGMRNMVTHQYHRRDWRIVWRDVEAGAFDELIKACERWLAARSQ